MLKTLRDGFLNPYTQILLGAVIVTGAELCLKVGAAETAHLAGSWTWTGLSGLASLWVWAGIVLMIVSMLTWLYVLKHLPLAVAYPISNVVHIFVPLGCWLLLGETIGGRRLCGIALVLIGLLVVAKPFSKMEEQL